MWNWHVQQFTEFLLLIRLEAMEFWIYSGIPAVIHNRPHPRLPSHLISTSNPRPTNIRWKLSCRNMKSDLPDSLFKWIIWAWLIQFRVSATRFPPDSGRAGIRGGDERGDEGGDGHGSQLEFRGLQPYKEQKLRKLLYMPISHSSFTVPLFSFRIKAELKKSLIQIHFSPRFS